MTRRILLANVTLAGRSGTEIVTRDLAVGLARRGHRVSVYAPRLGPIAETIRAGGIPVVAHLRDVAAAPEIIHGHHFVQTMEAITAFPDASAVFVCHDRTAGHSIPPRHPNVRVFVAVDRNCLERLDIEWKIPSDATRVIRNAVDLARFRPRAPLPPRPKRALIFSHYAEPGHYVDLLREVCRSREIDVDVVGAAFGTESAEPETILRDYDLVFAKARCALEAAVVGAAVILCAPTGLGPMLTSADAAGLHDWNLGAKTLREPLSTSSLLREIDRYDPDDAASVSTFLRSHASLDSAIDEYESAYTDALSGSPINALSTAGLAWINPLLGRIEALESQVGQFQLGDRMDALTDAELSSLAISMDDPPREMAPGATSFVRATLRNGLAERAVGTWPPFPVNWSYRWLRQDGGAELPVEGIRTSIQPPIAPKSAGELLVRVEAPAEAGSYTLRLTLVQEALRWLDRPPAEVYADAPVEVRFPNRPAIS